ncbi:hypothetical protein BsWGS_13210 [Bradybaena similaris]
MRIFHYFVNSSPAITQSLDTTVGMPSATTAQPAKDSSDELIITILMVLCLVLVFTAVVLAAIIIRRECTKRAGKDEKTPNKAGKKPGKTKKGKEQEENR